MSFRQIIPDGIINLTRRAMRNLCLDMMRKPLHTHIIPADAEYNAPNPHQQTEQMDMVEHIGNPELSPYNTFRNQLQLQYQHARFFVQLLGYNNYSNNPIMEEVSRTDTSDGYIFEYRQNNQKSLSNWCGQLYLQVNAIKNVLSLSTYARLNSYESEGHTYNHIYSHWNYGFNTQLTLGIFGIGANYGNRYHSLFGEQISYGENQGAINLAYKIKNANIGIGYLYPFNPKGWSSGGERLSSLVQKETWTYIKDNGNMLTLSFSWNFSYGRKYEAGNKTLDNMDYDSGIMK